VSDVQSLFRGGIAVSESKWCDLCKRNVVPQKPFNWLVFIFLCGICYLPIWLFLPKECPICKSKTFGPPQ